MILQSFSQPAFLLPDMTFSFSGLHVWFYLDYLSLMALRHSTQSRYMDWFEIAWFASYITVFLGLSLFGLHRYAMVYLFLKHSKSPPVPKGKFEELPVITVQLPIYNELHVVERLIRAVRGR